MGNLRKWKSGKSVLRIKGPIKYRACSLTTPVLNQKVLEKKDPRKNEKRQLWSANFKTRREKGREDTGGPLMENIFRGVTKAQGGEKHFPRKKFE